MNKLNPNAIEENLFSGLQRRDQQIMATGQNIVSKQKQEAVLNTTNPPASQSSMQLQPAQYQPPKE